MVLVKAKFFFIHNQGNLPDYITTETYESLKKKFKYIEILNKKFICTLCSNSKSDAKKTDWAKGGVTVKEDGETRDKYRKIYKKAEKHFNSLAHLNLIQTEHKSKENLLPRLAAKITNKNLSATEKLLTLAYYIALNNRPFRDYPKLIRLLRSFNIQLGLSLRDDKTCTRMIEHISKIMKSDLFTEIVNSDAKFSLVVDESDTISKQFCLIIYLNAFIRGKCYSVFLDLIEVEKRDARSIYEKIIFALKKVGFKDHQIHQRLIQLTSDGASTFTGHKSGVGALFREKIPKIVIWHCLAHRLELSVNDARSKHVSIAEFEQVFNQIYKYYSKSSKNISKIKEIAADLHVQFKKIGKLFTIRWVSSSHSAVKAIINNYAALVTHFKEIDRKLYKKLKDVNFVINLLTMEDALLPISILSRQLQKRNLNLPDAHKLIINCVRKLKMLAKISNQQAENSTKNLEYKSVALRNSNICSILNRESFFVDLANKIKERSLATVHTSNLKKDQLDENECEYVTLFSMAKVTNKKIWPENPDEMYGISQIKQAAAFYELNEKNLLEEFGLFKELNYPLKSLPNLQKLDNTFDTYTVSSADAERGFSDMNEIMTKKRNRLTVPHLSSSMTISTIKMPIEEFMPEKYSKTWIDTHQCAESSRNTKRAKVDTPYFQDLFFLFK